MPRKITTQEFIERARNIHRDKYGYDRSVYTKMKDYVEIYCFSCKMYFKQRADHHVAGRGCDLCGLKAGHEIAIQKARETFEQKAKKVHRDNYLYHLVEYVNNHTNVQIYCKKHDYVYEQSPNSHLSGHGCDKCGVEKIKQKQMWSTEKFIKKAQEVHGFDHYDYSKVDYTGSWKLVVIHCNVHDYDFKQAPGSHIAGSGCDRCGYETVANKRRKPLEQFLEEVSLVHPKYDFSKFVYINHFTHGDIICDCGHLFPATPANLLRGHGCPTCWESRGEREVRYVLEEYGVTYQPEKMFQDCQYESYLRMDFFLPNHNCIIEFHGGQHEKPVDYAGKGKEWAQRNFILTRIRDMIKKNYCIQRGIQFIEIPEKDFNKIPEILTTALNLANEEESA